MKKRLLLFPIALLFLVLYGCVSSRTPETTPTQIAEQSPDTKVYALVVKSVENPYMTTMYEGFRTACEELGVQAMLKGPGENALPGQPTILQELLDQPVDAMAIAANDMAEISPMLKEAGEKQIPVVSLDSMVYPEERKVHIQQASPETIGRVLIQACAKMMDYEGEFAILTTTDTMPNQTIWLQWMKQELEDHPDTYKNMRLVAVVYGMDEEKPSAEGTAYLVERYPDLKMIVAPTTMGLQAAAAELQRLGSKVRVTGLGLPSAMEPYIMNGMCPWMYLWNPSDVGYLAAYALDALSDGTAQGHADEVLSAGSLGEKIITESVDGGTEIVLGNPKVFDMTNIAVWGELF